MQYIQGQSQVVEKIVKVEDTAKIRELEEKLEKEKEEIRLHAEEERKQIEMAKNMAETEKSKLLEEIQKTEEENRTAKEHQQKLLKKLKNMEEKLVTGSQMMEQAVRQEQELQRTQQELERRKREDEMRMRALREKEEENFMLEKKFTSQREEIEEKDKKLKKLWTKYQVAQAEVNDLQREFQREREDMVDTIRFLTRQVKLKSICLEHFIPSADIATIEKRAEWNEEMEDFSVPKTDLTGNALLSKRATVGEKPLKHARVPGADELPPEQTIEEYDGLVSQRVQNTVQSLLNDIDDDIQYMPIDTNPSVYFVYTDEGAMREENNPKAQKKQRLKSAKRPSTASRKGRKAGSAEVEEPAKPAAAPEYPKARGLVSRGNQ